MIDPSLILQRAIVTALKADATCKALVDVRIYDDVPPSAPFPYVSIGPGQSIPNDADCIIGFDVFQQIDVWSREIGYDECKTIAEAVRAALHNIEFSQDGVTFEIQHQFTNYNPDPDGTTRHGVLSFRAQIDT